MKLRIYLLPVLAILFLGASSLQAQKTRQVKDGYSVKQIILSKSGAEELKAAPLFDEVAVLKGTTLYPKKGYKIIALQDGKSAGIVPDYFMAGKETMGQFQKLAVKGFLGGCFCSTGGGCRLRASTGRNGAQKYNCEGSCDCGAGLLIVGIGRLIDPAKKENAEGTNEWPYSGSNFPHGF